MAEAQNGPFEGDPGRVQRVSRVTRRDIFDYLQTEGGPWWGRLGDVAFLTRVYDLDALPSTDPRYTTAHRDIVQHRVYNEDWDDDWVFHDPRFKLASGPDEIVLDFLAQVVHPIVQPDADRASKVVADLNHFLAPDGWTLKPQKEISGRPVYAPIRISDAGDQPSVLTPPRSVTNQSGGTARNVVQLHTLHGDLVIGDAASCQDEAPIGTLIVQLADPFALEVHRPIDVAARVAADAVPTLPPYIPRAHDEQLAEIVSRAASGQSTVATLIGGSSTGKTRACWEAIQGLPQGWRLWHPISPERPEAALDELSRVAPHTVVWLNEAQFYLLTADPAVGERVAAGLRDLLRDPKRQPVLALATIWPQYWQRLIVPPRLDAERDPHAQARMLVAGTGIEVPEAFNGPELTALARNAQVDPRLAEALSHAEDGRVTQFLAGVPALLERYQTAPPVTKALIHAAMDARDLGCGPSLPLALLESAAPGYLSDHEWEAAGDDWLEQALHYTSQPCYGVRGPLTRVRSRTGPRSDDDGTAEDPVRPQTSDQPRYRLADYLEQIGRRTRAHNVRPPTLWDALVAHADPSDLMGLAEQASARALHRHAALLYKRAIASGNTQAARPLLDLLQTIDRDHLRDVTQWVATHADIKNSDDLTALLRILHQADATCAVATLVNRAVAQADFTRSPALITLLLELHRAGAEDAVAELARRAAVHTHTADLRDIAGLLEAMRRINAHDALVRLAGRAAAQADLSDPLAVAILLDALRQSGTDEAVATLLSRDPAKHTDCRDPRTVAALLDALCEASDESAVAELTARATTNTDVSDPLASARLIDALRQTNAKDAIVTLAGRAAAQVDLSDPLAVAVLLDALRQSGTDEAVATLLSRDPAKHADCSNPRAVRVLLDTLRDAGACEAALTLAARDTADKSSRGRRDSLVQTQRLPFGREVDGSPAPAWGWRDLN
ncbi:hypothetical protein AB0L00_41920 [Actinoallomurus sp. NPDC052308]|uniref:AbiJ-related protein n=1 Tax=Actinoallomurus sp. NPDC052308 TaxID=3155530 RepID=UPI00343E6DBE